MNMRFHGILEELFASAPNVTVLKAFLAFPRKEFSGRELAREAGLPAMSAWRSLLVLESHGVVSRRRVGRTDLWKLNGNHFIARKFAAIASMDADAVSQLKSILQRRLPMQAVEKIYLFGSFARREERPTSDIDVLVVVSLETDKQKILEASNRAVLDVLSLFANHLSVIVASKREFGRRLALYEEIRKGGKLVYAK